MKKGGGKSKGANFEREVCKLLSLFVTDNERNDIFWRSAMSGGRSTVQGKKGIVNKVQSGDVSAVDPLGHPFLERFCVEIKHYKDLKLHSLLFGKPTKESILDFWIQIAAESFRVEKAPMLIAKQNNYPTLVCVSKGGDINRFFTNCLNKIAVYPKYDMAIYLFDEFLKEVDHETLIYEISKRRK
jgi:hypothetical protein